MNSIVIIGGGISGLRAAQILHDKGVDFILIEKSTSLGGRVKSENFKGYTLDHGFQVLQTAYSEVKRSLSILNLDLSYFYSGAYVLQEGKFSAFLNPMRFPLKFFKNINSSGANFSDFLKLGWIWFKTQGTILPITSDTETTFELIQRYRFSAKFQNQFFKPFFAGIFFDEKLSPPASLFFFYMKQFLEGKAALPKLGIGAIATDLAQNIPKNKILLGVSVSKIKGKILELDNGKTLHFDHLILATDPLNASSLLKIAFVSGSNFSSKTFYFSLNSCIKTALPLIHLMTHNSGPLLHFSCLTQVNSSLAPKGKHLISATSLQTNTSESEIVCALSNVLKIPSLDFTFLKSFTIPYSLFKVGCFDELYQKAEVESIILAGDYTLFPSLQAALLSGRMAAEKILKVSVQ